MNIFKSRYSENFIHNCFKTFLDNKHRIQEKVITVPKTPLFLALSYLGPLSLQTRTKLGKYLKVFSIVGNYTLYLRVKTNQQMLLVLKIEF